MPKQKVDEQAIIVQSLKLFRQKSYNDISMADIARACGILKGSIYHYFSGKEQLMETVIKYVHEHFRTHIFAQAYKENIPAVQRLKNLAAESEKVFFDAKTGKLYGNMGIESALVVPQFNPIIRQFFQDFFDALKFIYQDKYAENIASELAERSVAEVEGSIMMARIFNDKSYIENTHKRIIYRLEKPATKKAKAEILDDL